MRSEATPNAILNQEKRQVLDIDRHVGKRIQRRRHELGLTQQEISRDLNISYQQIQKYERGHNRISAGKLWLLAQAMGVEISYFFRAIPSSCYPAKTQDGPTADQFPELKQLEDGSLRQAISDLIESIVVQQKEAD